MLLWSPLQAMGVALFSPKDSRVPRVVVPLSDCPPMIVNTFTEAINIHVTVATLYEPRSIELCMSYCIAFLVESCLILSIPLHNAQIPPPR